MNESSKIAKRTIKPNETSSGYEESESSATEQGNQTIIEDIYNSYNTRKKQTKAEDCSMENRDEKLEKIESKIDSLERKFEKTSSDNIELKSDIREIKTHINWIIAIIPVSITIACFVLGLMSAHSNSNVNSLRNEMKTELQSINNKFDTMEKYNKLYIENEVNKKFLEGKKKN